MPTSASDRLARLFVSTPLPERPRPGEERANQQSSAVTDPVINLDLPQHGQNLQESDEDDGDEYVALFHRDPKMKTSRPENGHTRVNETCTTHESTSAENLKTITPVPKGKISLSRQEEPLELKERLQKIKSYNGNGHPLVGKFCQFNLVAKLPYKYMDDPNSRVSRQFFASNKFYDRTWDLYFLHPPESLAKGPLLFVPSDQVQKLLDEISRSFNISMDMPSFPFIASFYEDGTPVPQLLGTSNSRDEVNQLIEGIPMAEIEHEEYPSNGSKSLIDSYEIFRLKCEQISVAAKSKKTKSKQAKTKRQHFVVQESYNQIKRAERYLGLRPRTKPVARPEGLTWNEEQANEKAQLRSCGLLVDFLDVDKPAQYPFDCEPILISVDVEWYERSPGLVTEIGISTLDTLDLVGLAPGPAGENWIKHIRSRHFRIQGREYLVNRDFCIGNPNGFRFGKSEFVELDKVPDVIDSCFNWPYSFQFKRPEAIDTVYESNEDQATPPTADDIEKGQKGTHQRNIVLLGQDLSTDLDYLRDLGSKILDPSRRETETETGRPPHKCPPVSILETLDTALMYQSWSNEAQPRNLGYICARMGVDAWSLHNGGNDARYTLECLVKMAIRARQHEDETQRDRDPSSKGVLENELNAESLRRVDERMDKVRHKIQHRHEDDAASAPRQVADNDDDGDQDPY